MSDWKHFHLLSKARLAAVADRVNEALPQLARGWWSGACPIQLAGVTPAVDLREQLNLSHVRYLLRSGDLWLALLGVDHVWMKLAGAWLGCDVLAGAGQDARMAENAGMRGTGSLTRHLQKEFCVELFTHLAAPAVIEAVVLEPEDAPKLPSSALRTGSGAVAIELDIDGVPLTLVAPIDLWPQLATPAVKASRQSLSSVAAALGKTRVALNVCLPAVQWSVAEAAALTVGDFVDLRQDLSGRAHVTAANMRLTLAGVLGKEAGCKAVTLTDEITPT